MEQSRMKVGFASVVRARRQDEVGSREEVSCRILEGKVVARGLT